MECYTTWDESPQTIVSQIKNTKYYYLQHLNNFTTTKVNTKARYGNTWKQTCANCQGPFSLHDHYGGTRSCLKLHYDYIDTHYQGRLSTGLHSLAGSSLSSRDTTGWGRRSQGRVYLWDWWTAAWACCLLCPPVRSWQSPSLRIWRRVTGDLTPASFCFAPCQFSSSLYHLQW